MAAVGTIEIYDNKLILKYYDGRKMTFVNDKPDYSVGSQSISIGDNKYFLKRD